MLHTSFARSIVLLFVIVTLLSAGSSVAAPATPSARSAAPADAAALLDMVMEHDALLSHVLEKLYERNLISQTPDQFKQMLMETLAEMAASDVPEIAPGCLLPYTIAATALITYTPTTFILFLNEISNGDEECAIMYGSWSIAGICFALASWTQYRICAEQNAETPDQTTIARLQSDLQTMTIGAIAAAGSGVFFRSGCSTSFFELTGLKRRKRK